MLREYPEAPLVGVGVIVFKEGKILLVKRGRQPSQGLWAIPGGLVELGEKVREAAVREVYEECGIHVEVGDVVSVVDLIVKDKEDKVRFHYVLIDFEAIYKQGELTASSDIQDAQWVSHDELNQFDIPEITRKVIEKAFS